MIDAISILGTNKKEKIVIIIGGLISLINFFNQHTICNFILQL